MKGLKLVVLLPAVLAVQCAMSQTSTHLTLSDQYPAAGEKISITYDPAGTAVAGKDNVTATIYFLDNKHFPVTHLTLNPVGTGLGGEFTIPDSTKAFFINVGAGEVFENNNDKGYIYRIYKDKQPVEGAYAMNGLVFLPTVENHYAKIKIDNDEGVGLFNKEFELYPNGDKAYVSSYYTTIARAPDFKGIVSKKIVELEKSTNEKDLNLASALLKLQKNKTAADSLDAMIRVKFPNGTLVRNDLGATIFKEKDPAKKDSLYNVYINRYPEDKTEKNTIQDNFRMQLALAYLDKGDMPNYYKYENQLKNKGNLATELNNIAYEWAKKGEHLDDAQKLSKESLDIVNEQINNPEPTPFTAAWEVKAMYQYTYDMDADTYAFVLAKENKFAEALTYEQPVIDHSNAVDPDIYGNYINILIGNGMDDKAQQAAETAVKAGQGVAAIKEALKIEYIRSHGNDNGYDAYVTALGKPWKDKALSALAKEMINKPAPAFTLKDLAGKDVSLADFKGKIVIVDFWATWCGPCKASFPGMQMAVDKYKDNPNVKFLFLDTWESDQNYVDGVKKFIGDNKYSFYVLLDDKMVGNRRGKVVDDFGVTGIPTKFIIDKNGNIRLTHIGYTGTPEALVDEVSAMIDMTNNPDLVTSAPAADNGKSGSK
ncbi:MAG TPA: TlpA disulfide reductase family protein [Mucilaginibacter sp.]|jgi:thiol-disulfide isomerase/thioredoxin|nr:TlpA disulfide reductase family protein [Mucilaginibacter sp.]